MLALKPPEHPQAILLILLAAGVVFAIDATVKLGVAGAVPYVAVVLLAAWWSRPRRVVATAALCSLLTILGFALSPAGEDLWVVIYNRLLALFAIWVSVAYALRRRRIELALRESRRELTTLMENLPGLAYQRRLDERWTTLFASAGADDLTGHAPLALTRNKLGWLGMLHPDDRAQAAQSVRDSTDLDRPYRVQYRIRTASGAIRWVQDHGCAIRRGLGLTILEGFVVDVTELRRAQERTQARDKLSALGVLAAGFAHEIGNPLAAISAIAETIERRADDQLLKQRVGQLELHMARINTIMTQIVDFAEPPLRERGPVSVNTAIDRALRVLHFDSRLQHGVLRMDLMHDLPTVEGVEEDLVQLFANLGLNALDAVSGAPADREPEITVRSRLVETDLGTTVRVDVEDNGPGFLPEVGRQIFDPFFTTKDVGRGVGLGLSTAMRIAQAHGGRIHAASTQGQGACFRIDLPAEPASEEDRGRLPLGEEGREPGQEGDGAA